MTKPLVLDLFSGLWGWTEGFISQGWQSIGIDLTLPPWIPEGARFAQFDVMDLHLPHIKELAPDFIVASPPCQEYSYRAMPWSRAKKLPPPDNTLFNRCFEIQRLASKVKKQYVPMVVENVRGAQKWVGQAKWHFGSFYLWGDVPALMPITFSPKVKGQNWSKFKETGEISPHWKMQGFKLPGNNSERRWEDRPIKRLNDSVGWSGTIMRENGSHSDKRKAASAEIARIPFPLSQHIASCALQIISYNASTTHCNGTSRRSEGK